MHNKTLTSLSVGNNALADAGMVVLSDVLKSNKTMTALYVDKNNVTCAGADALFSALPFNETLGTLYLSNNPLGNKWIVAANQALSKNSSLDSLYVAKCGITDSGVSQLSEDKQGIICKHSSLTTLDLTENEITEAGAISIGTALEDNVCMLKLHLSEFDKSKKKNFSDTSSGKISDLLKRNQEMAEHYGYPDILSSLR
jgi:Ran GTPase-activating protein (RanGAP) involved in mRNA processing and transport